MLIAARRLAITLAALISGCSHIGPGTVERDRFDYNAAISNSWKEQTLLNIVKLRYADMPLFVEVASVVSGYSLEGSVSLNGQLTEGTSAVPDLLSLGTSGKFTDRPTITYAPITGAQFNRSFMTPIPPRAILFLLQSGWRADAVLALTVDAINGLRSRVPAGSSRREGSANYYRLIELMRELQLSDAVGMHLVKEKDDSETTVMFFTREDASPRVKGLIEEALALMGVRPGAREVKIAYGLLPQNDLEIRMLTRSILQIMVALAARVEVPGEDVADGRTLPALSRAGSPAQGATDLIRIDHSSERPENAFVAVRYRERWFSIDDRDYRSKRTFAFLMLLFSLTETGGTEGLPLVTIPAS